MKKVIIYLVIIIGILFLNSLNIVYSQENDDKFNQAYREYSLVSEDYRKAHDDYVLSRSQYLRFKTLTSQNKAKESTLTMLRSRDEVLIKYLTALKTKAEGEEGIDEGTLQALVLRLNEEIGWFSDHRDRLSSAGTLDDLVTDSENARVRYEAITPFIYEVLVGISTGKVNNFDERLDSIFGDTKDKVNKIKEEDRDAYKFSNRKIQIIDRWIFETESKITRSEEKRGEATEKIGEFGERTVQDVKIYNNILDTLGQSQLYLKEASSFVKEIIREIMTAE
jgi:hypothetical protein